jgi:transposase
LQAEIARLKQTPRNSSRPPSSVHPHARPLPGKPKSSRRRGGQPGHEKHQRALIPVEQCAEVVDHRPEACRRCGEALEGHDPSPLRHQVWELPEIRPLVHEHRLHRLRCSRCGITTAAALPEGVPAGQAGSRLVALAALLMGSYRQSKRQVARLFEQVLGLPCSPGWIVKLQHRATAALRPAYEELVAQLPTQPVLGVDESPTRQGHARAWLWTFVARDFSAFAVRPTRAATVLDELLTGDFDGTITCDRARMYLKRPRLQWCWAHLKRDFQAYIDGPDRRARRLGHDLTRSTRELFRHWSRCRDGTIGRAELRRVMAPVRRTIESLLLRGAFGGNPAVAGTCRELYEHRERLWTFLEVEGVEPTNNASERALRHAVIWRQLSFGTQSERGSRFVETLLTVAETCRQQSRDTFAFITDAVRHTFAHQPTPTILGV